MLDWVKPYAMATKKEEEFTKLIHKIQKALDDCFVYYDTYYGYKTNELKEFCSDCLVSQVYEEDDEDETWHYLYEPSIDNVKMLMHYLANWDMVVLKNDRCVVSRSNHQSVAKKLNEMMKMVTL